MNKLQRVTAFFTAALFVFLAASPSVAQDGDDLMDRLSFGVKAMQGAQFVRVDADDTLPGEAEFGFQRVRVNFEVSADIHERISFFVDFGHEPNDFGSGGNSFSPAVDYVALDFLLSEEITLRFGTPVTGPFNFRGYSDGAATQGNPLIGNSPIDFVTAQTGVQLLGSTEGGFGFDVTATTPTFFEAYTPGTGVSLIGKAKFATETFGIGAAVMKATSQPRSGVATSWIVGDGENYSVPGAGGTGASGQPNRYTHALINPGFQPLVLHADAMFKSDIADADFWGGITQEKYSFADTGGNPTVARGASGLVEEDSKMLFLGGTLKINATPSFFLAGRVSYANNTSDWAPDDETALLRIQGGVGVSFWEKAMLKFEFVSQDEGVASPGQVGENWYGVSTELSVTL
ncbi:hypothetical protein CRI94_01720 [Longibacter salinarum]|uniref:Porin n=1 Tax=Longibacter salinarum TaxID=1850348 RepID=A0A2A8D2B9_9BACT|nr:hypothetical protein [Longibacter salinarum]PEN15031.1 hypothetical protein CRI94_01720 [Longibacter salinarum]